MQLHNILASNINLHITIDLYSYALPEKVYSSFSFLRYFQKNFVKFSLDITQIISYILSIRAQIEETLCSLKRVLEGKDGLQVNLRHKYTAVWSSMSDKVWYVHDEIMMIMICQFHFTAVLTQ